jgi:hypothetical protein
MATLISKSANISVANIVARNAIARRVDQMCVEVLDAIGDTQAGNGWAMYLWSAARNVWMLVSKEVENTITFVQEEKTIAADAITTNFVPSSQIVWEAYVTLANGSIIDINPTVSGSTVTLGSVVPGEYDGLKLTYKYCYGQTAAQIAAAAYSKAETDALVAAATASAELDMSTYRSNKDADGVYTVIERKRFDGTLYKRSTLSGGTAPNYTTRTVAYYAEDGTTVTSTLVYTLTYSGTDVVSEVRVS